MHKLPPLPQSFIAHTHARPERRDALEHRRRILEVAQRLFAEQGVDTVSMHQIAGAAGVGQGTLYRRYAHKGELCMDLMHEHQEHFVEEIASQLATKESAPALERLDGVLTIMVAFFEEQGALLESAAVANLRTLQCRASDTHPHPTLQRPPVYSWLHELLSELFTEAVAQKELTHLDIPYTVDAILATLHPIIYGIQRHERGFSPERILQGLRRIYIDGLKTPRAQSE